MFKDEIATVEPETANSGPLRLLQNTLATPGGTPLIDTDASDEMREVSS